MNKENIATILVTAMMSTVSNRVYRNVFPQPPAQPVWPAIRYTFISLTPYPDQCGDGGEEAADYRVQIDLVDLTSQGQSSFSSLTAAVKAQLAALQPVFQWAGEFEDYDFDTKTTRISMDFLVFPSSPAP